MRKLITASCVSLLAVSSAIAQETPQALQDAFVAGIVAEDAVAIAALYTKDAASYGPDGGVASGSAAIAASWAPFFEGYDGFSITLDQQGALDMGKKGHAAWGLWTMSATPISDGEAEPIVWNGRFTDVAVKTKDGWRYIADHASMVRPADHDGDAGEKMSTEN